MSKGKISLLIISLFILLPLSASALMVVTDSIATVEVGDVINENYFAAANTVTIDGDVNGDVYAFGNEVTINGTIQGDVIGAATLFEINGEVMGNVRVVGGTTLRLNGPIGKNATVAGTTVTLTDNGSIGWSMMSGSQTTNINGPIAGNFTTASETVVINNTIGNNTHVTLGETGQLSIKSGVEIGGDLYYRGTKSASVEPTAVILGDTTHKQWEHTASNVKDAFSRNWFFFKLISLFGVLLVGTILISAFPKWTTATSQTMLDNPGKQILWGGLLFIVTPIAVAILIATLIGLPLAIIVLVVYLLAIYSSKIFIGIVIGKKLFSLAGKKDEPALIWVMMVGTFIFVALVAIPFVGWIISLGGIVWFLGAAREGFAQKNK